MDSWINAKRYNPGRLDEISPLGELMEYTKRRNLNRGYMKLETWQRGMDLFVLACRLSRRIGDFKLKSQFLDAVQSVSANIAEGYGRRTLPEYIQSLYIAKGSLGETLTRAIGGWRAKLLTDAEFEEFDKLHYEIENKLIRLIASLEPKRGTGQWAEVLPHDSSTAGTTSTQSTALAPRTLHAAPGRPIH